MVNKYFFGKYSDKKIIFLTKNLYRTVSGDNQKIYCLEDYVEEVCSIIEQNDIFFNICIDISEKLCYFIEKV